MSIYWYSNRIANRFLRHPQDSPIIGINLPIYKSDPQGFWVSKRSIVDEQHVSIFNNLEIAVLSFYQKPYIFKQGCNSMSLSESTKAVHGHFFDRDTGAFIPPIYLTTVFEQRGEPRLSDRGFELKYSREENPTVRALERVMAELEHGMDSLAFNSGMAAISTLFVSLLSPGAKVLLPMEVYGSTMDLLMKLSKLFSADVDIAIPETERIAEMIRERKPNIVFVETITNPTLRVIDIEAVAKECSDVNCTFIVDNTFSTPILINPLEKGARFVVHSLTKYISGHNDLLGGCISLKNREDLELLWDWRRLMGGIMQPFEAYLALRGVKTLEVRFERTSRSAQEIADFLQGHPAVERVLYPGLNNSPYKRIADRIFKRRLYGGVVSFVVRGGENAALRVLRKVKIIKPSPSLGGAESLLTYPVKSAAKPILENMREIVGITPGLLRLSVGLEDVNDIIEDLDQALRS
jgi:cystathionine gamma-synthase